MHLESNIGIGILTYIFAVAIYRWAEVRGGRAGESSTKIGTACYQRSVTADPYACRVRQPGYRT